MAPLSCRSAKVSLLGAGAESLKRVERMQQRRPGLKLLTRGGVLRDLLGGAVGRGLVAIVEEGFHPVLVRQVPAPGVPVVNAVYTDRSRERYWRCNGKEKTSHRSQKKRKREGREREVSQSGFDSNF